jgi:pimeloyl-ACP methyl ester carboxylesterase
VASRPLQGDREALEAAEERLFATLELERRTRRVALHDAPVGHARVLEAGDGPPLLLIHGAGMTAGVWAPLLVHLPHRRGICVDLPGCGLTDPFDHRKVDLRDHARAFLAAVLDALGLPAAPVAANSLGATYSLYLAAADPTRVSRMVLLGATGVALPGAQGSLAMRLYSRPAAGRLLSALSPPVGPGLARRILTSVCGRPAVANVPDDMIDLVAAATRISEPTTRTLMPELFASGRPRPELALSDDELAAIRCPTRFVWGSHDRSQPPTAGRSAASAMPHAELIEVAGGHHPWWDDPARCAALLDEHLGDQ